MPHASFDKINAERRRPGRRFRQSAQRRGRNAQAAGFGGGRAAASTARSTSWRATTALHEPLGVLAEGTRMGFKISDQMRICRSAER